MSDELISIKIHPVQVDIVAMRKAKEGRKR